MEEKEHHPKTDHQIMDDLIQKSERLRKRHNETNAKIEELRNETNEILHGHKNNLKDAPADSL